MTPRDWAAVFAGVVAWGIAFYLWLDEQPRSAAPAVALPGTFTGCSQVEFDQYGRPHVLPMSIGTCAPYPPDPCPTVGPPHIVGGDYVEVLRRKEKSPTVKPGCAETRLG